MCIGTKVIKAEFCLVVVATCSRCTLFHLRGFNALLFPDLNLTVFCDLASASFIVLDRFWSLPVRSCPKGMTPLGPEVERRGMRHDLRSVRSQPPHMSRVLTLLSQNAIELVSQLKRTWKSTLALICWNRKFKMVSDSALGMPMMRRVKPGLT